MKLRLHGNSVRLRLGQREVRRLAQEGIVEETTVFGPTATERFTYELRSPADERTVSCSFGAGRLTIAVPRALVQRWASTDDVGIDASVEAGGGEMLRILIEKDFECLDAAADESQADAFPHP